MRRCRVGLWAVVVAMAVGVAACRGQASNPGAGTSSTTPPAATTKVTKKRVVRRPKPHVKPGATTEVIPLETAPPSPPPSPAAEAQQKAKDHRLLEEQERQSAQAAQITNQQVEKAQQEKDSIQKEVRIQDAPGPAQTGVVPAAGPPVVPVNADQRIQDAPGPAQTLPPPVQPQPTNPPEGS